MGMSGTGRQCLTTAGKLFKAQRFRWVFSFTNGWFRFLALHGLTFTDIGKQYLFSLTPAPVPHDNSLVNGAVPLDRLLVGQVGGAGRGQTFSRCGAEWLVIDIDTRPNSEANAPVYRVILSRYPQAAIEMNPNVAHRECCDSEKYQATSMVRSLLLTRKICLSKSGHVQ